MYTIISRNQCNFCDQAKALLEGANKEYVEYNIQEETSAWLLYILKQSSITTVPQVFSENGSYIGGYRELKEWLTIKEG
jgi:glutaredoxin